MMLVLMCLIPLLPLISTLLIIPFCTHLPFIIIIELVCPVAVCIVLICFYARCFFSSLGSWMLVQSVFAVISAHVLTSLHQFSWAEVFRRADSRPFLS